MIDFTGVFTIFLIHLASIVIYGIGMAAAVAIGYVMGRPSDARGEDSDSRCISISATINHEAQQKGGESL